MRAPHGLGPGARLVHRGEYEAVYRSGSRRAAGAFVVFYRANGGETTRYGTSVKKQIGNAVVRNRIRRRIREILRRNSREIPAGWDVVIHPRRTVAQGNFAQLESELLRLLRGIGTSSGTSKGT